ncbi:MAG: hypothetical protein RR232_08735, partial [Clostridia bacterium]
VRARDFTQDEVYHFFSLFCGDTPMYLVQDVLTKAQIEELIVTIRRDAVELRASGDEGDLSTAEYYESISIPALEKLYEIAPQAVDINVT